MKEYIHRDNFLYPRWKQDNYAYKDYQQLILTVVGEHSWSNGQKVVEGVDFFIEETLHSLTGEIPELVERVAIPLNTQKYFLIVRSK